MPVLDAALSCEAATAWLDRGFPVFPLKPCGKVPLGSLVPHGLKEASRDPAVIRDWWRRAPNANIGLTIQFWCEGCPALPVLRLAQHKGSTLCSWDLSKTSTPHGNV